MVQINAAIAAELAGGARDVLSQAGAVLTGNQAAYIASGEPESIYGRIQQETARRACRAYADDPGAFQGRASVLVENACRPYLDGIGYGSPPAIEKPFEGGQKSEVYIVTIARRNGDGSPDTPIQRRTRGPISAMRSIPVPGNPGSFQRQLGSWSAVLNASTCGSVTGSGFRWTTIASTTELAVYSVQSVQICAGVDDGGDPPPEVLPPGPPAVPNPPTGPYNPGPGIDINIDVDINPDGSFDVDFGIGPVNIDPFGEDEPTEEPGGPTGPPPGDVGSPGTPEDTGPGGGAGEGGESEGEAPPGSVLTGLRLQVLDVPGSVKRFTSEVIRGAAYVYMGVPGLLDHDPAGAMLTEDQFVFAEKENLTAWRVRANFGYNIRVTPYYREVE